MMTRRPRGRLGPVGLVLLSIGSVQFGGALAATLIPAVGVLGSVALRLGVAALVMLAVVRPSPRAHSRRDWVTVGAFGLALAFMNTAFYGSLAHLPIGVAVTIEFLGPLTLSAALSRRLRDGAAVLAAALGIVLISCIATTPWADLEPVGIALALTAGAAWAAYILLSRRAGAAFCGADGIAWAMTVAALVVVPAGLAAAAPARADAGILAKGAAVALLSSVLPYTLELFALRSLHPRAFGILLSLEPAVAALAGLLVLGQTLSVLQLAGMTLVVLASALVTLGAPDEAPAAT